MGMLPSIKGSTLAGTAAEALGRRDLANFSAVILDRKLPNATADEMLPAIRFAAPGASVVIVTGYSDSTFAPMAVAEIRA
jgi:DNA-binding NtrC family response regulator